MEILPVQNLAPVRPLLALKQKGADNKNYLAEAIKDRFSEYMLREEATWNEVANTTEIVSNFVQGKQIFRLDPFSGQYRIQSFRTLNPNKVSSINLMQRYLTENLQRLSSSNPDLEPSEEFLRSEYRDKIKTAAAVWNRYEQKFYTKYFNQQEALHSILSGNYIESCQYDLLERGATAFHDVFGEVQHELSPGKGKCYACGAEGVSKEFMPDEDDAPVCPHCGSYEVTHERALNETLMQPIGRQPIQMGDFTIKLIPIQAARWDLRVRPEESSWFIERTEVATGRVKLMFGNDVDFGEADKEDRNLESLRNIQKAGNTLAGKSGNKAMTPDKTTIIDRFSMMPEDYVDVKLGQDEETVDGEILDKNTNLTDLAPNGCTVIGINGMKHVLGIYPNAHHSNEIASGSFHMRLSSGLGRGSEDTVEVQKRFNRFDNQNIKAMQAGATPAHTYVESAIDRKHVKKIGHPGTAIPIRQDVALAMGTTDLVKQIPPSSMQGSYLQYTYDILNQYRLITSHNNTNSIGRGGIPNDTATAARIGDANDAAIWMPMLEIKGEVRERTAQNLIRAYPKHFKGVSQYMVLGKTKDGMIQGKEISGDDIDPEILFIVKRNSEQPKTRYHQQADFERFAATMGGAEGMIALKQVDPALYQYTQETYGLSLEDDGYDIVEDICRDRLSQARDTLYTLKRNIYLQGVDAENLPIEQFLNPEALALVLEPPIEVFEGKHEQKLMWFQEYLDTPEGYALATIDRKLVGAFIQTHLMMAQMAAGIVAEAQGTVEQSANQPSQDQENATELARHEIEQQAGAEDADRDLAVKREERQAAREDKILDAKLSIAQEAARARYSPGNKKTEAA